MQKLLKQTEKKPQIILILNFQIFLSSHQLTYDQFIYIIHNLL
jgi:hypothetical protein